MSKVKEDLLKEIEARIAKKKLAKARAFNNRCVETFVLTFIKNIEDTNTMVDNQYEWSNNAKSAESSLLGQIRSFDDGAKVSVSWCIREGEKPVVDTVTINWSKSYQQSEKCDAQIVLSAADIILFS